MGAILAQAVIFASVATVSRAIPCGRASSFSRMLPKRASASAKGPKPMTKTGIAKAIAQQHELKTKVTAKVINVLAQIATKEVQTVGKFTLPKLLTIKSRHKPATKACKKMIFGEMTTVKAKPAKTVVKAYPVAALKKSV